MPRRFECRVASSENPGFAPGDVIEATAFTHSWKEEGESSEGPYTTFFQGVHVDGRSQRVVVSQQSYFNDEPQGTLVLFEETTETPNGSALATAKPVDVRSEGWYQAFRHSSFATVRNMLMLGHKQVKLVQVKPPAHCERTNEELPALMQDIRDAYLLKKSPFCTNDGSEVIPASSITLAQDSKEDLATALEFYSRGDNCAIVVSCAEPDFDDVERIVADHNRTNESKGLNKVLVGYATANDMYSNPRRD